MIFKIDKYRKAINGFPYFLLLILFLHFNHKFLIFYGYRNAVRRKNLQFPQSGKKNIVRFAGKKGGKKTKRREFSSRAFQFARLNLVDSPQKTNSRTSFADNTSVFRRL